MADSPQNAQNFFDAFDDRIEENPILTDSDKDIIGAAFPDQAALEKSLPAILGRISDFETNIQASDTRIKQWQEAKKMWKNRMEQMLSILNKTLVRLHVPGAKLRAEGVQLANNSRESLEVDEDWLLQQYQTLADAFQQTLPAFITVKISVDKTRLSAYLKQDNSLLVDHPDKVHTKKTVSTTIKAIKSGK